MQHFEHFVSADGQERSSHSTDIFLLNATVGRKDFSLSGDLARPLLEGELFTETVTVGRMDGELD